MITLSPHSSHPQHTQSLAGEDGVFWEMQLGNAVPQTVHTVAWKALGMSVIQDS